MNTKPILLVASALSIGSLISLGGCASHTHRMLLQNDAESVIGSFTHEGNSPPFMSVNIDGKTYESKGFTVRRAENFSELRQIYGVSSKHYQRISAGLDTDHRYYSAAPVLLSMDGSSMKCSLAWKSGTSPAGICEAPNGKVISFATD